MGASTAAIRAPADAGPRPLTVLDITEWFGETSGGVRTYLQQKGEYVQRHPGLRQVLVVPGAEDVMLEDGPVRRYELRGPRIPTQQQYRFLLATRTLRRIVCTERPDVIEVGSQMLSPWLTRLAARGERIPMVAFYHTNLERLLAGTDGAPLWRTAARAPVRAYMRQLDALFDARIAASESVERDLRQAGIGQITRIPLGVDLALFHPKRRAAAAHVRSRVGVPADAPLVLYLGRLAREKELTLLLAAWRQVECASNAWLVLVGDGPLGPVLRARARGARVLFLPFENDRCRVAELLASAALFVAPGRSETFGLAPLEAMACGTPVLGADQGAVAELITQSRGGVTFRAGNRESLAAAMRLLLGGNSAALGTWGRRYAEREHAWDTSFDRVFDLYRQLRRS